MRRAKDSTQRTGRQAARHLEIEPRLLDALDHLGRLLAKEYARALAGQAPNGAAPPSEKER